jgi:transposase
MYQNFIGIDIGKNDFCVGIYGQKKTKVFANYCEGFDDFYDYYKDSLMQGLVVLETTGGYELALIEYLQNRKVSVHRANTRKVKYFIRSYGKLGKSDPIDALSLAHYGKERHQELELFKPNLQQKLLLLAERRRELKQMLVQEKNRRQSPSQTSLKMSFDKIISVLEKEIESITDEIKQICKQDNLLEKKKQILKKISGIGDIIAMELLAFLPELGTINRRKIASLGGLAPHPNESGLRHGYRMTRGGRKSIKPILFMAAMTAARSHSALGEFYSRLVNSGKKKMVALTALMRKILVISNAKLRDFFVENQISQHS